MSAPSDEQLARDFIAWSDLELREHFEASMRVAGEQRAHAYHDRRTSKTHEGACRKSADRYQREMLRRAKEAAK